MGELGGRVGGLGGDCPWRRSSSAACLAAGASGSRQRLAPVARASGSRQWLARGHRHCVQVVLRLHVPLTDARRGARTQELADSLVGSKKSIAIGFGVFALGYISIGPSPLLFFIPGSWVEGSVAWLLIFIGASFTMVLAPPLTLKCGAPVPRHLRLPRHLYLPL